MNPFVILDMPSFSSIGSKLYIANIGQKINWSQPIWEELIDVEDQSICVMYTMASPQKTWNMDSLVVHTLLKTNILCINLIQFIFLMDISHVHFKVNEHNCVYHKLIIVTCHNQHTWFLKIDLITFSILTQKLSQHKLSYG
jgi:hypothetical protein